GLTHFASLGNEADLRFDDFLEWLLLEPDVSVVIAYLEQIRRPDRLIELAEVARQQSKSIVLLRVGRSATASRIALTHTGSIVGSLGHEEAFLEEIGVHVVHGINEAAAVASALRQPTRWPGGAAIVATTGGLSATFADLAHAYHVDLPDLEPPV